MAHDIRLVKLVNGETVLGKWDDAEKVLKDVAVIQTMPTQQGAQLLILPFGYPFEQEFTGSITETNILYTYKNFPEEIKTKYLEATSNLTLSTAGDLKALNRMAKSAGKESGSDFASQFLRK